jgi:SAM-dependent methyltransferase
MEFGKSMIRDAESKRVLEIGSADVNGTLRFHVQSQNPKIYIGTDLEKTPGSGWAVDLKITAEELCDYFKEEIFDIIICTEMLEHAEDWRIVIFAIDRLLKTGGYVVLTTRGPGFPYHEHPVDRWRFTVDDMNDIFRDYDVIAEPDPEYPGVLVKAVKLEKTGFRMPITLARLKTIKVMEILKS